MEKMHCVWLKVRLWNELIDSVIMIHTAAILNPDNTQDLHSFLCVFYIHSEQRISHTHILSHTHKQHIHNVHAHTLTIGASQHHVTTACSQFSTDQDHHSTRRCSASDKVPSSARALFTTARVSSRQARSFS